MQLVSRSFVHQGRIPAPFAFGCLASDGPMALSLNRSPHLAWSGAPEDTRSFALICVDPDAPTVADDVNQADRAISADQPRQDFYHWVMVNIPAALTELAEGACGEGVVARGKQNPPGPAGSSQGVNDYTGFMAGDPAMAGDYFGYDGPCPPWNDLRRHHYHFRIYALQVDRIEVPERFSAAEALAAISGHVIAEAELIGTYSLNPQLA